MTRSLNFAALVAILLLAACNGRDKPAPGETDPAVSGALGEQIMVDPQMGGDQGAALAAKGASIELPPEARGPEAIAVAQADAARLAGGALKPAPAPGQGSAASLVENAATAAQVAERSKAASTNCSGKVQYSAMWAAKLPTEIPVYPRGSVQEAAGTDDNGCALRIVNFVSPVEPRAVIDFYHTIALRGGYGADYRIDGSDHVIGGKKGARAYLVYARKLANGLTEVDLITSGT